MTENESAQNSTKGTLNMDSGSSILRYAFLAVFAMTAFIATSLFWTINNLKEQVVALATVEARANWNKDQAFRRWATRHGGFYVKPDERTPPNPYLEHLPNRDITTSDGQELTLMNPAYMMSQMTREFEKLYGIKGSITGQVLLNPANKADAWELNALKQFDEGVNEVIEQTLIDNQPFIRFMRPMVMTEGCLLCHGHLGFKVGDIRGGVSISIPLEPYFASAKANERVLYFSHGSVWFMGLLAIGFISQRRYQHAKERQQAEAELARHRDHLQVLVDERTSELVEARDTADRANKAKSDFLAKMSHELRTPLNSIIGLSEFLHEEASESGDTNYVDPLLRVTRSGQHLLELINDILDLSKIEAGKLELNAKTTRLDGLVDQVNSTIASQVSANGNRLVVENTSNVEILYTDPVRLRQVLLNLLSNASKFTENGQITLTISRSTGNPHDSILFDVSDTGLGIPKDRIDSLFTDFTQIQNEEARDQEGTGLGLSISQKIVELMGGTIQVESEEGKGTRFWFEIPLHEPQPS